MSLRLMKKVTISAFDLFEKKFSHAFFKSFREKNALIVFLIHVLFHDKKEIDLNFVNSEGRITIQNFRQFVEYYLSNGYTFVSPNDILNGLDSNKKYILITFDDGYFNNQYALPILKEYQIPAVFFISTNHIVYNKCFWWDVLYRKRIKQGISVRNIMRETTHLKSKTNEGIEKYIKDLFGKDAFKPISDIDRVLTPLELKDFSNEKYVFLGNHTSDHAILTNYSQDGIRSQILNAQTTIYDITGITPIIISYPNGNYSDEVIRISKEIGLKLGITVDSRKNYLPIEFENDVYMRLGRFILQGDDGFIEQLESFRLNKGIRKIIKNIKSSLKR